MSKKTMFVVLNHNAAAMTGTKTVVAAAFTSENDANEWVRHRLREMDYEIREATMQIEFDYAAGEYVCMDLLHIYVPSGLELRAAIHSSYPRNLPWAHEAHEATGVPVKFEYEE